MTFKQSWYRFKQFRQAVRSKLTYSDVEFIRQYLTKQEQIIFYRMQVVDQKHSLLLAHKCLNRNHVAQEIDKNKLIRAALMHDAGKAWMKIALFHRILYVLLEKFGNGKLLGNLARENSKLRFRRVLWTLLHHGETGARLLMTFEEDPEIVNTVLNHHNKPTTREGYIIPIIREIDNQV
ncbi:MAG: HDIG domain-containing protein [Candidatus Margulisbacteria bacterium]|nr:HDIG domain-containing protein [Candidatus Margulisiibacteriota bacterium]